MRVLEALVVVKAYPNPSRALSEAVCVAAIAKEDGLVRLYPIPFRDLDDAKKFAKYQVIRIGVRQPKGDARPSTFRPELSTLELLGSPLPTVDGWRERKEWVLPWVSESMCAIQRQQEARGLSLGVFKPREVVDVEQEADGHEDWTPAELSKLNQGDLFQTGDKKPLEKVPYNWRYRYICSDPACNGHRQQIIDWEIHELYRGLKRRGITDPKRIHEKIREKYLGELCGQGKDVYFFTGNMAKYPQSFLILGVFWPPKEAQMRLFR